MTWDLERDRPFLELMAERGQVVVTAASPDRPLSKALTAPVPVETDTLAGALALTATFRAKEVPHATTDR